ncbi:hypothetical protein DFH09DRAFT_1072860 [Mycena vulgaris]|nr:hypothetical protein DFH09DRAFT_1072860 [Mycena vulgaris]
MISLLSRSTLPPSVVASASMIKLQGAHASSFEAQVIGENDGSDAPYNSLERTGYRVACGISVVYDAEERVGMQLDSPTVSASSYITYKNEGCTGTQGREQSNCDGSNRDYGYRLYTNEGVAVLTMIESKLGPAPTETEGKEWSRRSTGYASSV